MNQMKIAICDDEKFFANDIKTKVENFMYKNRIESDIHTFYCSETFEDDSFYDIAFLDIEMPGLNGIELATKLKKVNPDIRTYLGAAKGKEPFYEKFGFEIRPNGDVGAGMILYNK